MIKDKKNQTLGEYIRDRRTSRGLSLADAAALSGLHLSYWSKLEDGQYESPAPKHLMSIARALEVDFEDLYSLAGYESPERLPTFSPYLRAKYELPPEAVADLERFFELLRSYYDIPKDQPVFPPKPKEPKKPTEPKGDVTSRRAA
ncbi:MAG: helix-turn-helix transcriptional regulator [Acidimicrobiales bacterium]|jgi:transcriptional regulator with XRE-family HTH domain